MLAQPKTDSDLLPTTSRFIWFNAFRTDCKLSANAKNVGVQIWGHHGGSEGSHPYVSTLAAETGLCSGAVRKAIREQIGRAHV